MQLSAAPYSSTFERVCMLIARGAVVISSHGAAELLADNIAVADVLVGVFGAQAIEDYPEHGRGPCALALQRDNTGAPAHMLWGVLKDSPGPAVLITAYRPDPDLWEDGWQTRRP
jgi:hypothetical protein